MECRWLVGGVILWPFFEEFAKGNLGEVFLRIPARRTVAGSRPPKFGAPPTTESSIARHRHGGNLGSTSGGEDPNCFCHFQGRPGSG